MLSHADDFSSIDGWFFLVKRKIEGSRKLTIYRSLMDVHCCISIFFLFIREV